MQYHEFIIQQGIFPDSLKIAKEHESLATNYRPISVLSAFCKVFEKIIYNKLTSFIDTKDILYKKQFGFRRKYSTCHALLDFTEKISKAIANKDNLPGFFL